MLDGRGGSPTLMAIVDRRDKLCLNVPTCGECESRQVQLIAYREMPALWRCRQCKHQFTYEPIFKP